METAQKIGLLPGFRWFAGRRFAITLLICWLVSPIGLILVGLIGESRLIPLSPMHQFTSFFPGDIFLGITAAGLLVLAQRLPSVDRWYNNEWWHILVLSITVRFAVAKIISQIQGGDPLRRQLSPTQLYHSLILWGGFGYVTIATFVAVVAGSAWSWRFARRFSVAMLGVAVWVVCIVYDATAPLGDKIEQIHNSTWQPIWVTFWRWLRLHYGF